MHVELCGATTYIVGYLYMLSLVELYILIDILLFQLQGCYSKQSKKKKNTLALGLPTISRAAKVKALSVYYISLVAQKMHSAYII